MRTRDSGNESIDHLKLTTSMVLEYALNNPLMIHDFDVTEENN